jgi:hypothetical protein
MSKYNTEGAAVFSLWENQGLTSSGSAQRNFRKRTRATTRKKQTIPAEIVAARPPKTRKTLNNAR